MIQHAAITWRQDDQGNTVPVSKQFDDIYFSQTSGLDESRYVFIRHNHLDSRFEHHLKTHCPHNHPTNSDNQANRHNHRVKDTTTPTAFVIAETGFGTGLNFLATAKLWCDIAQRYPNSRAGLHFISTEKYPLSPDDLSTALTAWQHQNPTLDGLINELLASYPLALQGGHRRYFASHLSVPIRLDLWLGDACDSLTAIYHTAYTLNTPTYPISQTNNNPAPKPNKTNNKSDGSNHINSNHINSNDINDLDDTNNHQTDDLGDISSNSHLMDNVVNSNLNNNTLNNDNLKSTNQAEPNTINHRQQTTANQPTQLPAPFIDAWFLDGFAPKKNTTLWSDKLFDCINALSAPNATLATFTAAGDVRRKLLGIGATVQKVKGFGRKRQMLSAKFDTPKPPLPHKNPPSTAIVIGAGVSGLMTAYSLAIRGIKVCILDKTAPLAGASGNLRALLCPKLPHHDTADRHLPTLAFLYSQACYRQFNRLSSTPIFEPTGVIDFLQPTKKSPKQCLAHIDSYPDTLITRHSDNPVSGYVPMAGLINPKALADWVLSHHNIRFCQATITAISQDDGQCYVNGNRIHNNISNNHNSNKTASHFYHSNRKNNSDTDSLHSADSLQHSADVVVICAGFESHHLHPNAFVCRHIRGQVSYVSDPSICQQFDTHYPYPVKYDGYACRFGQTILFGASFIRNSTCQQPSDDEHLSNLTKLKTALPHAPAIDPKTLKARVGIRAQTPDYHPITGQLDRRIYINTAMGSKGFSFAPLCGELVSGLIMQEILPIDQAVMAQLCPHRPRLKTPLSALNT